MSVSRLYFKAFHLWTQGTNCLLHHMFSFGFSPNNFIIFCTAQKDTCDRIIMALKQLYPSSLFTLIASNKEYNLCACNNVKIIQYPHSPILDYMCYEQHIADKLYYDKSDILIYCYSLNIIYNADLQQIFSANEHYRHLKLISENIGNEHSYFIGPELKVHHIDDLFPCQKIQCIDGEFTVPDSLMSQQELQALYDYAQKTPPETMVIEFGHYLGGSTICLAKSTADGNHNTLVSIDQHTPHLASKLIYLENLRKHSIADRVQSYFCSAADFMIYHWPFIAGPVGLVFVDTDKSFDHIMTLCHFWADKIVPNGYLILEDYSCCFGVLEAVRTFLKVNESFIIEQEIAPMLILRKNSL